MKLNVKIKIINDLLTLVRMDKNATELNISQVNINNLVEQILKRVRPIAKTRSIEIVFESFRPVTADVDETKLSLAVTNLVENGVKYNNDGGWVRVSVNADHKYFYKIKFDLTLSDFKNFDFANAKMALVSKKREGYIIFYNDSLIASDNELEIKFYNLKDLNKNF